MEEAILAMAFQIIKAVVKNPAKKARLKKRLLAIADAINAAYGE